MESSPALIPQQTMNFLDLPPELRNQIYETLFTCDTGILNPIRQYVGIPPLCDCEGKALFDVSRQVHSESQPIFLRRHEIHILLAKERRERVRAWFAALTEASIHAIRRMEVKTFAGEPDDATPKVFKVDLDGEPCVSSFDSRVAWAREMGVKYRSSTQKKLEAWTRTLAVVDRRRVLTREAVWEVFENVGWF